jgi:anti-sigma factor RsiW
MNEMICGDVVDLLPDWVAGRLDGAGADAVAAHVAGCARCAADADVLRALRASRPAVPADLASRIARAARTGADAAEAPRPRIRRLAPTWALSAAAVLALAVGTTVLLDRGAPVELELAEVAVEEEAGELISDDVVVAGAPVLEELSDDDLAALLEDMGG